MVVIWRCERLLPVEVAALLLSLVMRVVPARVSVATTIVLVMIVGRRCAAAGSALSRGRIKVRRRLSVGRRGRDGRRLVVARSAPGAAAAAASDGRAVLPVLSVRRPATAEVIRC